VSEEINARDRLLRACYSFLVPIARFLLRSGVSFSEFSDIARAAFVRVAASDYGIRGRETNTSRIAAMTGISRREVARVRETLSEYERDPRVRLSPASDVLHRWHTDPQYLDSAGLPVALPVVGQGRSFAKLVATVSSDIPPGAMRAELIRNGTAVEVDGHLVLSKRHVVPNSVDGKVITALAFNFRGLAATIAHNSNPRRTEPGWIERFVHSAPLSQQVVRREREGLRRRIERFSEEIDDLFADLEQLSGPIASDTATQRLGIGVYYTEDDFDS
jgi:Family of unknown function (DUF6502)